MVAQIHAKRAQDIVHKENRKSANDYLTQTTALANLQADVNCDRIKMIDNRLLP